MTQPFTNVCLSRCRCCVLILQQAQASILQGRKDQAGKLLREKQEVQEMLDQAQLELSKMKNEGAMIKDNLPQLQQSIKDTRDNLSELHELIAEEKKNPTARSDVQVGQNGQLMLGAARSSTSSSALASAAGHSAGSKTGSLGGGKSAAAALGLDDEDDAFAVPDIPLPAAGTRTPVTLLSPSAAGATAGRPSVGTSAAKHIFGDDDDAFAVPDISLPAPSTAKATIAATSASAGAFDAFDFVGGAAGGTASSGVKATLPPAKAGNALDAFGEADWGADPFAGAAPSASAASNSATAATATASNNGAGAFGAFDAADPFGSASFGAPPTSSSLTPPMTAAPPSTAAPPPALTRPGSLPQPPPPPPSAAPPAPKAASAILTSPKAAPPASAPTPAPSAAAPSTKAATSSTALAGFDDDGWDVPAAVAGSDAVKSTGDGWGTGDESSWGF